MAPQCAVWRTRVFGLALLATPLALRARPLEQNGAASSPVKSGDGDAWLEDHVYEVHADGHVKGRLGAPLKHQGGGRLMRRPRGDSPSLVEEQALPTSKGITQEVTCDQGYVWLVVTEQRTPPPPNIVKNVPKGMCIQQLVRSGGTSFWEGRTHAILEYLQQQPRVEFVVLADTDIHVNQLSLDDMKSRFNKLATPTARIVVSAEQNCWFGHICTSDEANDWLRAVGAKLNRTGDIERFPNSQYMGEANAVKGMLEQALVVSPRNDQHALALLIKDNPERFALDTGETLFVSMIRGLVHQPQGKYMCSFRGVAASCELPTIDWGSCGKQSNGFIRITQHDNPLNQERNMDPLVIHFNGNVNTVKKAMARGSRCVELLGNGVPL